MDAYLIEYLPIAVFLAIAVALAGAFVIGSVLVGAQRPDPEKLSAYECGFEAFDDSAHVLIFVSIWLLSCSSFLIWKSLSFFPELSHLAKSGLLVSGQ